MTPQIWTMIMMFIGGQFVFIVAALFRFQSNTLTKLKELEIRIIASEKRLTVVEADDKTIIHKLDSIIETIHQIDLKVANKKDRDN